MSPGDQVDLARTNDASFEEFVAGASGRLFTMALLLTGRRRAEAEDLLQEVLERAYRRWGKIARTDLPEPYIRQMLVNAAIDWRRRVRRRREEPLLPGCVDAVSPDQAGAAEDRDVLLRALAVLPPRQRAVLVLRFFEDLTAAQTAAILGCGVGTVKSQASRALARLREINTPTGATDAAGRPTGSDSHPKGPGNHG